MKSPKNILLIIASMCFMTIIGAAVYEHAVLIPKWSAAPPSSLTMFQGKYGLHAENFWIPIHPITLIFLIAALFANWRTGRRRRILIVLCSYVFMLALTFGYFVPELLILIGTPYSDLADAGLIQRASAWETLSLIRLIVLVGLGFVLLSSLTKSNEKHKKHVSQAAPVSYENDSLGG